jgi:hypothetical protein
VFQPTTNELNHKQATIDVRGSIDGRIPPPIVVFQELLHTVSED